MKGIYKLIFDDDPNAINISIGLQLYEKEIVSNLKINASSYKF